MIQEDTTKTHYDDFHTIDWLKDLARDRFRHRIIQRRRKESIWQKIVMLHDSWSGWICVLLVGLSSGLVAGVVDIGSNWITHIKDGICVNAFWLNRAQCCWASKMIYFDNYTNPKCPEVFFQHFDDIVNRFNFSFFFSGEAGPKFLTTKEMVLANIFSVICFILFGQ